MTHNSPINFKLIHVLLLIKGSHQSPNFETFECSGENLPNSSCHFWKHKSVFFQISHQSSLSSTIIPLYFFSSNIVDVGQKQPTKEQVFEIFQVFGSKFSKFLMSIWNLQDNPSSNFASFFFAMILKTPVNFKLIHFLLWIKGSHQSPNFETFEYSSKDLPNSSFHF